jgi:hypothetical protein
MAVRRHGRVVAAMSLKHRAGKNLPPQFRHNLPSLLGKKARNGYRKLAVQDPDRV